MPNKNGEISYQPKFLNESMLDTPAIALSLARKEVSRMGSLALGNTKRAFSCINQYDSKKVKYIKEHEPVIDNLEEAITVYLTKMSEKEPQRGTDQYPYRSASLLHGFGAYWRSCRNHCQASQVHE